MTQTATGLIMACLRASCGGVFCFFSVAAPLAAQQALISTTNGVFHSINSGSVTASGTFTDSALSVTETFTVSGGDKTRERTEYGPSIGDDCTGCMMSVSAQGATIGIASIGDAPRSGPSASQGSEAAGLSITGGTYTAQNSGAVSADGTFTSLKMGSNGKRNTFGVNATGSSITLSVNSSN